MLPLYTHVYTHMYTHTCTHNIHTQDAEWFESKRSKRRPGSGRPAGGGGGLAHNGGHPSAAGPGLMAGGGAGGRGRAQQHVPMQHQQQQQARTFATASAFASLDGLGDNELDDGLAAYAAAASHGVAAAAPLVPELATMGALEEDGEAAGDGGGPGAEPTMMSREARALFLNGGGDVALRAWRVRSLDHCCCCCYTFIASMRVSCTFVIRTDLLHPRLPS